ncbi:MAG: energy transducer TonB [Deltaproteobacteria bacterium]|nr:energy transducer TonB [Deltaproteobacteria bacterium]
MVILASVALHGLILGCALWWSREAPRPRRVVTVEAICLTTGSGHAGGRAGSTTSGKPQITPRPLPPKPQPVKEKPKPRPVKPPPVLKVEEPPLPPALSIPRPSALAPVRPGPAAAVSPGSGSGRGEGEGSGQEAGRGTGPDSGSGTGSGPGSAPGPGSGSGEALKSYLAQVRRLLEKQKTYPWMARRQHREGVVVLKFTIGQGGEIAGHTIARSSGHEVLDGAAAEALQKVGRFPPLPATLGRSQLKIEVPLAFRLSGF